jgi:hypothetical protein
VRRDSGCHHERRAAHGSLEKLPRGEPAPESWIDDEIDDPSTIDPLVADPQSTAQRSNLPDHIVVLHQQLIGVERRAKRVPVEQPVEVRGLALARIGREILREKRQQLRMVPRVIRHDLHRRQRGWQ